MDTTNMHKVAQVVTGWGFFLVTKWIFDNPLYLAVIAGKGLVVGGLIMTAVATVINLATLLGYEWRKRKGVDHLGMDDADKVRGEVAAKVRKYEAAPFFTQVIFCVPVIIAKVGLWLLNHGDRFSFLALSAYDPIIALAYIRRGKVGYLSLRDWALFIVSNGIANFFWSLWNYSIVLIAGFMWGLRDVLIDTGSDIVHFLFIFGCS